MKGLLTKDLCLLMQRKRIFIIILVFGAAISFSTEPAFFIGWLVMIGMLFSISTIAYDEYDNSMPFLLTLPISRKVYALEKYAFSFLCALACWLTGILLFLINSICRGTAANWGSQILQLMIILFAGMILFDLCIPFNLKFGPEKGRIYMLILWGAAFALISIILSKTGNDSGTFENYTGPAVLPALTGIIIVLAVIATAVSAMISIRIMEKKEY